MSQYARTYPSLTDIRATGSAADSFLDPPAAPLTEREVNKIPARPRWARAAPAPSTTTMFLAGASRPGDAINFFAYDAGTGSTRRVFAGSDYNYVRGSALVDGVLHLGGDRRRTARSRWTGTAGLVAPGYDYCNQSAEVGGITANVQHHATSTARGWIWLATTTVPIRRAAGATRSRHRRAMPGNGTGV